MATPLGIVVDDDIHVRAFLARVLRRGGLEVVEATSGFDALRLAQAVNPAFVVTDLEMPDLNGLELCRQIRQSPATAHLLVVLVTGTATTRADEAIAAGCDAVLAKPCPPNLLVATIRRLLANRPGRAH